MLSLVSLILYSELNVNVYLFNYFIDPFGRVYFYDCSNNLDSI